MSEFEVVVGNVGIVYAGSDNSEADLFFFTYRDDSAAGYGCAAFETVTLLQDGEIIREFEPVIDYD